MRRQSPVAAYPAASPATEVRKISCAASNPLSHNRAAWLVAIVLAVAGSAIYLLTLTDLAWWLCPIAVVPVLVLMVARLAEDDLDQQLPPQDLGGGGFGAP